MVKAHLPAEGAKNVRTIACAPQTLAFGHCDSRNGSGITDGAEITTVLEQTVLAAVVKEANAQTRV